MIITETITINGKEFTKNYSDAGYMIQKVGTEESYVEAINPINKKYKHSLMLKQVEEIL